MKQIIKIAFLGFFIPLSIILIEYKGDDTWVDLAGNIFGVLFLMCIGEYMRLEILQEDD